MAITFIYEIDLLKITVSHLLKYALKYAIKVEICIKICYLYDKYFCSRCSIKYHL